MRRRNVFICFLSIFYILTSCNAENSNEKKINNKSFETSEILTSKDVLEIAEVESSEETMLFNGENISVTTDDDHQVEYTLILNSRYNNDSIRQNNIKKVALQPLNLESNLYINDVDYSVGSLCDFYLDFDNNGTTESFVSRAFGSEFSHYIELWFVDDNNCTLIKTDINKNIWFSTVDNEKEVITFTVNEPNIREYPYTVYAYTVYDGQIVSLSYKGNYEIFWDQVLISFDEETEKPINWNEFDLIPVL